MLYLLHLQRDNRKQEIKAGKRNILIYASIFVQFKSNCNYNCNSNGLFLIIQILHKRKIFLCGCRHVHTYNSVYMKCSEKLCTPLGSYINIYPKQTPQKYNLTLKTLPTVFRPTIYYYNI